MDAETIKREASEALLDLQLDSTVTNIAQDDKNWCIQFAGDYGQLCDSFQNQFEHDNSPRVVREKIKKHLLAQITQLRNKGGRRTTRKSFDEQDERNVTEMFQEALTETTRAIGEAIERTLGVTGRGIKAAGDVAETIGARTAEIIRPASSVEPARPQTRRKPAQKSAPGQVAGKAKRGEATKKAAAKTKRASGTKKAGAKKSSRKR
ncbi:MAG TPA: hypothetical protein VGC66_05715 [Pyrinomonadaceae bacterium]|jgi:hypothetical protein